MSNLFVDPLAPVVINRASSANSGDVLDQLADGYYEMDREFRYRRVNAAGARLAGKTSTEMLGQRVLDLFPEIAGTDVHQAVERAMTGAGPEHIETYYPPLNLWAINSVYPLADGVAIVSYDITDRHRAAERDRALAAIVTAADDAIVTKRLDGTVTSWNPGAERLFGWTADDMVSNSITRIVPEEKRDELRDILARVGRGEQIDHHETVRVTRDGRRIDVSVSISPLVDDDGRVVGAVKIGRDISARRAAEEQREEFFAAVSHDLKNPLGGIKANAQLLLRAVLRDEIPDHERLTRALSAIDDAVTRMVDLLDGLIDAARLRAGGTVAPETSRVDLIELANRAISEYQATTMLHTIRLETVLPDLIGQWNARHLERAVANLLTNAIKYSPQGGDILLRIATEADPEGRQMAIISVEDHGLGIPHDDLPLILERFRRGGNVGAIAGAGLGLSGVKQFVEQHSGTMNIESNEGIGTTVSISLPLALPRTNTP